MTSTAILVSRPTPDGRSRPPVRMFRRRFRDSSVRLVLERARFSHVERVRLAVTPTDGLGDLENAGRMLEGFPDLESIVVEAIRPSATDERDG